VPTRIAVRLSPAHRRAIPPQHTGPAIHAVLLGAVRRADPALAAHLHDSPKFKCFTLTPLLRADDDTPPRTPGEPARFEIGLLDDTHTAMILSALAGTETVEVGRTTYHLDAVDLTTTTSYPELAAQTRPATSWEFDLLTPVSFATPRDQGPRKQLPWPDATRVFTNLADRWDTFSPHGFAMPPDARTAIDEHLEVDAGAVHLVEHLVEPSRREHPDGYRRGSVGRVTFRLAMAKQLPEVAHHAVAALAQFAGYAGMGDRTAMGMGYTRHRRAAATRPARSPGSRQELSAPLG
jgi:CRISPR-associated endoribonuclease Cas6